MSISSLIAAMPGRHLRHQPRVRAADGGDDAELGGARLRGLLGRLDQRRDVEPRRADRRVEQAGLRAEVAVLRAPAGLERDDALDLDLRAAPAHPHLVGQREQRVERLVGQPQHVEDLRLGQARRPASSTWARAMSRMSKRGRRHEAGSLPSTAQRRRQAVTRGGGELRRAASDPAPAGRAPSSGYAGDGRAGRRGCSARRGRARQARRRRRARGRSGACASQRLDGERGVVERPEPGRRPRRGRARRAARRRRPACRRRRSAGPAGRPRPRRARGRGPWRAARPRRPPPSGVTGGMPARAGGGGRRERLGVAGELARGARPGASRTTSARSPGSPGATPGLRGLEHRDPRPRGRERARRARPSRPSCRRPSRCR